MLIGERDVTALPPADRAFSRVFQKYALFPHLGVRENILFDLKICRMPAAERARRLDRAAETLGLGPLLDRKPSQLSGGQQQRVALGRAIVSEAPLCLMDQPLSNLDAQLRQDMRREIRDLNTVALISFILAGQLVVSTLAAFAVARFTCPGRTLAFYAVPLQLMILPEALTVENYRMVAALGLVDTLPAVGLPYLASGFGTFLLRQAFLTVPRELDDAARVEGAGPLGLLWPLIVTNSVGTRPITVGS